MVENVNSKNHDLTKTILSRINTISGNIRAGIYTKDVFDLQLFTKNRDR